MGYDFASFNSASVSDANRFAASDAIDDSAPSSNLADALDKTSFGSVGFFRIGPSIASTNAINVTCLAGLEMRNRLGRRDARI